MSYLDSYSSAECLVLCASEKWAKVPPILKLAH